MRSLFIFRRDLRLEDNTGLLAALDSSDEVIPAFIFDPRQKDSEYFSENAFQFMVESLEDLDGQLQDKGSKLYVFEGMPEDIISNLKVDAVHVNRDYTPFSRKRDGQMRQACAKNGIAFYEHKDVLLIDPDEVMTGQGTPYKVFTPFWRKARAQGVPEPQTNRYTNYFSGKLDNTSLPDLDINPDIYVNGGRENAGNLLDNLDVDYAKRDIPSEQATTGLSAHHKFGTYSMREIYHLLKEKLGAKHDLLRQLYWRDFFTYVAYHYPYVFGKEFQEKYQGMEWERDQAKFEAWCKGQTGFPIVDAGMRELNTTGFMHNRVRMIVASFLIKDLHIDWRWGEKYFAQRLVDYDPSVNNGNWQWAASVGVDTKVRIFNPWRQQQRFDPEAAYIKRWVHELREIDEGIIMNWDAESISGDYPEPIVEHDEERKKAWDMYRS